MRQSIHDAIIYPAISEKGTVLGGQGKYVFRVRQDLNKISIKKAVQDIFKVKVKKVNTMNVRGKLKRLRNQPGRTSSWKKALVTLEKGEKIEFM